MSAPDPPSRAPTVMQHWGVTMTHPLNVVCCMLCELRGKAQDLFLPPPRRSRLGRGRSYLTHTQKPALSLTHDLLCVLLLDTWWNFGHKFKKMYVV